MKTIFKLLILVSILNFGLISCTVQDEIVTENSSEVQLTDPEDQEIDDDVDPN